jgi:hypothetical protein
MSEFDEAVPEGVVDPEITVDPESGGVVEVGAPVFSAEGVLLTPGVCEVSADGIVRGKVV